MQSPSSLSGVSLPENFYRGQKQVAEAVAAATDSVTAKLPTGYGKTRVFCAAFAIKLAQGVVDYMLYLVPRDAQVRQAAEEVPRILLADYGIQTTSVIVRDDPKVAIRNIRNGKTLVFVSTIQGLATSASTKDTLNELMHFGRWFRAIDEYHNLPLYVTENGQKRAGRYFEELETLPKAFEIRMTATPKLDNGNDPFPDPSPRVTYREALKEGVVKPLFLNTYEYRVDGLMVSGELVSFTTTELQDADGLEQMVLTGRMRWSPKYISPLILIPVERMNDYRLAGIKTQMIVRAATCSHAELVCSQIKALLPTLEVDWVGTGPNGRSDKENRDAIDRFCPPKNASGKRPWTLDVLVQRGIAGEGLDTTDVSEVVILSACTGTVQDMQLFGRGSRVIRDATGAVIKVNCTINVDSATEIAKDDRYLGAKVMDIFDADVPQEEEKEAEDPDPPGEYKEMPDDPIVILADVSLIDIRTEPGYKQMFDGLRSEQGASHKSDDELCEIADKVMRDYIARRDQSLNASSVVAQLRQQVDNAVGKVVSLIVRRISAKGMRIEKSLPGDLKRRLNTRKKSLFGAVDEGEDVLTDQYHWLKDLEREILSGELPSWLR